MVMMRCVMCDVLMADVDGSLELRAISLESGKQGTPRKK